MADIQDYIDEQSKELDDYTEAEVNKVLRMYEQSRIQLNDDLSNYIQNREDKTFSPLEISSFMAIIVAAQSQFSRDWDNRFKVLQVELESKALSNTLNVIRQKESVQNASLIEWNVKNRIAASSHLGLYAYSLEQTNRLLIDRAKNRLTQAALSEQKNTQIKTSLIGKQDSIYANFRSRIELVMRTEMARLYDAYHQIALEEAALVLDAGRTDDFLMKRADEYFDRRNHPFSLVLHGKVAPIKGEWEVSVYEVTKVAAKLKKSMGGILWRQVGGSYVGGSYPAHYNDRGRQVPWRNSWKT